VLVAGSSSRGLESYITKVSFVNPYVVLTCVCGYASQFIDEDSQILYAYIIVY
jgi:hypothetical protein